MRREQLKNSLVSLIYAIKFILFAQFLDLDEVQLDENMEIIKRQLRPFFSLCVCMCACFGSEAICWLLDIEKCLKKRLACVLFQRRNWLSQYTLFEALLRVCVCD